MFTKVLIANRGAIAVRIIRTLKKMGVASVSVYAEADADSLHVVFADEHYSLGDGAASDTYLNQDKILAIAKQCGAQAIHPGYGFLSENASFVSRCEAEKIAFIGPTIEQMEVFGLKHSARQLAQENSVPLLPGTELLLSMAEAKAAAADIGFPVILKSTAGGGGIGMQVCQDIDQVEKAFDSVKRLSANNFSNDGVFIEKYIERARHIEVQAFGDGKGKVVAFGERDCSAQRRHQKVIEETPAPNLTDAVREELAEVAIRLLAAVNYRNAGTVEFIYDQLAEKFYFLEVNTRLQVEHGVTEQVFGVDLVEWMVSLAANELDDIQILRDQLQSSGSAIQVRVYAENPHKNFQPSAGLLGSVRFPPDDGTSLRIDRWVESGVEVSPFFDPMLAKIIVWSGSREQSIADLRQAIADSVVQGIETNLDYVAEVLSSDVFTQGHIHTRYLNDFRYIPNSIDVIAAGTMTTIQDYPGRVGYWDVGVPPSGPFDALSFQLGNRLLGNDSQAAGLEITLTGPTLQFNKATRFALTGAIMAAELNGLPIEFNKVYAVASGDLLKVGKVVGSGARAYLAIAGGVEGCEYLGSRATFTLGQFGGFSGRALRTGDVLHLHQPVNDDKQSELSATFAAGEHITLDADISPTMENHWQLRVIYGPHGAPDFFTTKDIETFFAATWEVHYNSSRTGVRLIGPKPQWARETGGEAGMHPSNIHDNAYAVGTVDFTGDMPVILGPDGPSLGGFVCPVTVIAADLWKLGQLKAGAKVSFIPVTQASARALEIAQKDTIASLSEIPEPAIEPVSFSDLSPIVDRIAAQAGNVEVVYRQAGDKYLLVEYGPLMLDIRLRFRVHALMLYLQQKAHDGILELTPGIRSLQIHYDSLALSLETLLSYLHSAEQQLENLDDLTVPSRVVRIPLSWDDAACRLAIDKYMQSVRKDAPWCPSNIEFIRRINGIDSIDEVKKIVFSASYVVMGLGDVYLGAPVATPLDPRHRLVTTKYNPARTWTAENSVGIGGSYLCVYGMEGPGGYQFVGRTLQMWNRYRTTNEFSKPWLLRFFDQIQFYEVSAEELLRIRKDFPRGQYPLEITETTFSLRDYESFLATHEESINSFVTSRDNAFAEELERWVSSGQINFESSAADAIGEGNDTDYGNDCELVESSVAGSIWQWQVAEGEQVVEGQVVCVLESMKMEIELMAPCAGTVKKILRERGQSVQAGQGILVVEK